MTPSFPALLSDQTVATVNDQARRLTPVGMRSSL
jgi:hypothetical protein